MENGTYSVEMVVGESGAAFGTPQRKWQKPVINSFVVSPVDLPFTGGVVTVSWDVDEANSVAISLFPGETLAKKGTRTATVGGSVDVVLTASNPSYIATSLIKVKGWPQPTIKKFVLTATDILEGSGEVTVSWEVEEATAVAIDLFPGESLPLSGSRTAVIDHSESCVLTATNPITSNKAETYVRVWKKPIIKSFVFSPADVLTNDKATISWDTDETESVTIDQFPGETLGKTGSREVTVDKTTKYTLTAKNPVATSQADTTLTVWNKTAIKSFLVSPFDLLAPSGVVTLSWNVTDASSVLIDKLPGVQLPPVGTKQITATGDTTFVLSAFNPVSSDQSSCSVKVWLAAKVNNFTATPASLPYGGGSTTLSWDAANATGVTIDKLPGQTFAAAGTTQVPLGFSTNFILTASNPVSGDHAEVYVEVSTIKPHTKPASGSLAIAPMMLGIGGGTVTLTWTCDQADFAEITPGVGSVDVGGGSKTVQVTKDTVFSLFVENDLGSNTYSAAVTLKKPIDISKYFIYDWREMSSGPTDAATFSLPSQLITKGWWDYLFNPPYAGAKSLYDSYNNFGCDAIILHRPFGQPIVPDMQMDWCAWSYSKANANLFRVVSMNSFLAAFVEWYKRCRKPIFFYLGYPRDASPILVGKTNDQKKAILTESVSAIIALRNALIQQYPTDKNPVEIIMDTLADKDINQPANYLYKMAVDICLAAGMPRVHGEAWPAKISNFIKDKDYKYVCIESVLKVLDPEQNPGAISWAAYSKDVDAQIVAMITGHGGPYTVAQTKQRAITNLNKEFAIGWQGWDTGIWPNAAALKLEASVS